MDNRILVSSQVLTDTATSFRNNVAKMRELLNEASNSINTTSSYWSGQAAEGLRGKYERLKAVFEPFCENIENFAKFLDQSAANYEETESAVEKAAEETISDINM